MKNKLFITTPFIKLDSALKLAGAAMTGGEAKLMVQQGRVFVAGEPCSMRGRKLYPGDTFSLPETDSEWTVETA